MIVDRYHSVRPLALSRNWMTRASGSQVMLSTGSEFVLSPAIVAVSGPVAGPVIVKVSRVLLALRYQVPAAMFWSTAERAERDVRVNNRERAKRVRFIGDENRRLGMRLQRGGMKANNDHPRRAAVPGPPERPSPTGNGDGRGIAN